MDGVGALLEQRKNAIQINRIKYYKPQFCGHKWKDCYALLWPILSHFQWNSKKTYRQIGSIDIERTVPFIYTGIQTLNVRAKKPKIPLGYFVRNLVAISMDKKAEYVLWFLFETTSDLTFWVSMVKKSVKRLNPFFYNLQLKDVNTYSDRHYQTLDRKSSEKRRQLRRSYSSDRMNGIGGNIYSVEPSSYGQFGNRQGNWATPKNPMNFTFITTNNPSDGEIICVGGEGFNKNDCGSAGLYPGYYGGFSESGGGSWGGGDCGGGGGDCGGGDCGGGGGDGGGGGE